MYLALKNDALKVGSKSDVARKIIGILKLQVMTSITISKAKIIVSILLKRRITCIIKICP